VSDTAVCRCGHKAMLHRYRRATDTEGAHREGCQGYECECERFRPPARRAIPAQVTGEQDELTIDL